ncbi:hypothetical protein AGDE_16635 [Angomonas deanei]|uniref:Uncharacterized protein n=1 Tax=Angomonas deanei TaxID=59799 RepID=A0A7G2C6M1_9TRYP|nr:hypothetical protein AGDE_16635 [Angomonas deanei]CAD2213602.1 hypothetical protein, conserved [Angomonas deanei]|eukprot:EPY16735.1 hypothetical protein AGDE_16635 [Angomonas deanei]
MNSDNDSRKSDKSKSSKTANSTRGKRNLDDSDYRLEEMENAMGAAPHQGYGMNPNEESGLHYMNGATNGDWNAMQGDFNTMPSMGYPPMGGQGYPYQMENGYPTGASAPYPPMQGGFPVMNPFYNNNAPFQNNYPADDNFNNSGLV